MILGSLVIATLGLLFVVQAAVAAENPNIIVLFADDLGYGDLGCQGNPEIPTPHIDAIAANGVRFTSGYVPVNCGAPVGAFAMGLTVTV